MNKKSLLLSCLLFFAGAWHNVQAALVEITMNSVSKTMTLQNGSGATITEDSHTGNTYVFSSLPNGSYTIYGYNSTSELNGTLTFAVNDEDISMNIFTMTNVSVSNEGWVYGTDYTIEDYAVHSREGVLFPVTIGVNAGNPSILVYEGGSIVLRFVPSAARQAEGYVAANDGRTADGWHVYFHMPSRCRDCYDAKTWRSKRIRNHPLRSLYTHCSRIGGDKRKHQDLHMATR